MQSEANPAAAFDRARQAMLTAFQALAEEDPAQAWEEFDSTTTAMFQMVQLQGDR